MRGEHSRQWLRSSLGLARDDDDDDDGWMLADYSIQLDQHG